MRNALLTALATLTVALLCSPAYAQTHDTPEAAIRAVMDAQVKAWNHHDLEGFMAGYWNSPELTFFSGGKQAQGWQAALERYRKAYQGEGHQMGELSFADLRIEMLGRDAAFVRGRFHLNMPDGKQPQGLFTLIFRRFPQGWRIVHDHTCSD